MGTSPEAFNEVRNILKKLDHSIDAARSRRLSSDTEDEAEGNGRNGQENGEDRPIGRAKPIRRTGTDDGHTFGDRANGPGKARPAPRSGNF